MKNGFVSKENFLNVLKAVKFKNNDTIEGKEIDLEKGEKIITGDRIVGKENLDVKKIPKLMKKYLEKEGIDRLKVNELISDYRIFASFSCFINHRDCHNGNWGLIKNENGDYKFAHIFDLEGCLLENKYHIREFWVDDYDMDDKDILYELLQDDVARAKSKQFLNVDMKKVMRNVRLDKGIRVPKNMKNETYVLINKQKELLNDVINKIEKEKNKNKITDFKNEIEVENIEKHGSNYENLSNDVKKNSNNDKNLSNDVEKKNNNENKIER